MTVVSCSRYSTVADSFEAHHYSHEICKLCCPWLVISTTHWVWIFQSTFQNLLSTVVNTLVKASSLFGVLLCIIVTYAFVGNLFFTNVRSGEAVDYGLVNFNGVFVSMNIVFRVMTGEDWHQLLTDAMASSSLVFFFGMWILLLVVLGPMALLLGETCWVWQCTDSHYWIYFLLRCSYFHPYQCGCR